MQYKPRLLVDERRVTPDALDMAEERSPLSLGADDDAAREDMMEAETALQQPAHLPPKARFAPGKAVHV